MNNYFSTFESPFCFSSLTFLNPNIMKTKIYFYGALIAFAFAGCAKDGDIGPQGPQGAQGQNYSYTENGFMQGTVTGTRQDSTPFSYTFNYKYNYSPDYFRFEPFAADYYFSLGKYQNSNSAIGGMCRLDFTLPSLTSGTATSNYFYFNLEKDLGNSQTFFFTANTLPDSLYNVSCNSTTHEVTGDFNVSFTGNQSSTGNPGTITGYFKSKVVEYLYRKG